MRAVACSSGKSLRNEGELPAIRALSRLGYGDDRRLGPAQDLVRKKERRDERWPLEAVHPDLGRGANYDVDPGTRRFALERVGAPSTWITLRALAVTGPT